MNTPIPTNVITGFLGVGKTTALLNLLQQKPAHEYWAVLVNEFGEIGIDGAIIAALGNTQVREVPGGCLCCAGGVPMRVALNLLLSKKRPDRLLIEPTGLGHPGEIIKQLAGDDYARILDVRAAITLVDLRKLHDARYTEHEIFLGQLAVADVLVANKQDLLIEPAEQLLTQVKKLAPQAQHIMQTVQGEIPLVLLDLPCHLLQTLTKQLVANNFLAPKERFDLPVSLAEGELWLKKSQAKSNYHACGWLVDESILFNLHGLFLWASGLSIERFKAIVNTHEGVYILNAEQGVLSINEAGTSEPIASRFEFINLTMMDEDALAAALQHLAHG